MTNPAGVLRRRVRRHRAAARQASVFDRYLTFLDSTLDLDAAALDALQLRLLGEVVATARTIPFQARRLAAAGVSGPIESREQLEKVEPLGKTALRELAQGALLVESDGRGIVESATSGTTGQPFHFSVDGEYRARSRAVLAHLYRRLGYRGGAIIEIFFAAGAAGARVDHTPGFETYTLHYGLPEPEQAAIVRRLQPTTLYGNRSHLLLLAAELARGPEPVPHVDLVVTSSEELLDGDRAQLISTLGARVHHSYGLAEVSKVAFECEPERGFHVIDARNLVEVLRDGQPVAPGESGEIVVTSLDNLAMPFIRYATGDMARLADEPCACGRPGVVLEQIEGRKDDFLQRTDGRLVSPFSVHRPIFKPEWVTAAITGWQIVQDRPDHVTVSVVPSSSELPAQFADHVATTVRALLGDVRTDLVVTDAIPLDANTKFRAVRRAF